MKQRSTRSFLAGVLAVIGVLALSTSCDRSSVAPGLETGLQIGFAINLAGGAADAFDKADAIAVRLERNGVVVFQSVESFSSDGGDVRLRIPVDRELDGESLILHVDLLRESDVLFTGTAPITPSRSGSPVNLDLEPVVAAIVPPPDPLLTEIGARLVLDAAAVFATGDTIPSVQIGYTLLSSGIVRLLPQGIVESIAEGTARMRATAGNVSVDFDVRVRIAVGSVVVSPANALIGIGGSAQFSAVALANNGMVLTGRQIAWSSGNTAIATVNTTGLALGVTAGATRIIATVDGTSGSADLTVSAIPPPAAATDLVASASGTTVRISWTDNATNETAYEIHRGPVGGALSLIATLGANANSYIDSSLGVDQIVEYVVRACASGVCVDSNRLSARTVPTGPTNLSVLLLDPITNVFRIRWQDNSAAETEFAVEVLDPQGVPALVGTVGENVVEYQGTGSPGQTERFRVVACNAAGCSTPTNTVTLIFTLPAPLAVTLPSTTGTEMVGATDGFGKTYDWWFEADSDPSFSDPSTFGPFTTSSSGTWTYPLFYMLSLEKIYYRVVAMNNAGTTVGAVQLAAAPELVIGSPSTSTVCEGGSCGVNPASVTFTATSSGPSGSYANPFQDAVYFEIDGFMTLGIGNVSAFDNGITRTYTYTFTWTPAFSVSVGSYNIVAHGFPSSSGGSVITSAIVIVVDPA